MSKEWSVDDLRANFEWGGNVRLDPAIFDRAIAKIKADAIREVANEFERLASYGAPFKRMKLTEAENDEFWRFASVEKPGWMREQAARLDPS